MATGTRESMKALVRKYYLECITAAVCGTMCLTFLAPILAGVWRDWQPAQRASRDGRVVVYQVRTGLPLMRGDSVRDAVESRLRRIRASLADAVALDQASVSFEEISEKLVSAPPETAMRIRRLFKSFYGADLRGADLKNMDFRGTYLQHADFTGANLAGAQLDGTQLGGACFANANLTGVRFGARPDNLPDYRWPAGGDAPGAQFHGCNLEGETLGGRLSGASFQGANLRRATFRLWQCHDLDFRNADLTDAVIEISPAAEPGESPGTGRETFYETVLYDDNTKVQGLRMLGVSDTGVPFVRWAIAHGAVVAEAAEVAGMPVASAGF